MGASAQYPCEAILQKYDGAKTGHRGAGVPSGPSQNPARPFQSRYTRSAVPQNIASCSCAEYPFAIFFIAFQ